MSTKDRKKLSHDEQHRIYMLARRRLCLEDQAKQLKYEVHHLRKALRITQERIRKVNGKIEHIRQGGPKLALVVSND
jgi:predicted  nucleic acid-binding Zn-ribbon protein